MLKATKRLREKAEKEGYQLRGNSSVAQPRVVAALRESNEAFLAAIKSCQTIVSREGGECVRKLSQAYLHSKDALEEAFKFFSALSRFWWMSGYTTRVMSISDWIYDWRDRALAAKLPKV